MAHYVCRKGKYWSLEASVRVPGKKNPIKKRLAYFGTRRPSDPQARYEQMIATAERKGEAVDAAQKQLYGETNAERCARLEDEQIKALKEQIGLIANAEHCVRIAPEAVQSLPPETDHASSSGYTETDGEDGDASQSGPP